MDISRSESVGGDRVGGPTRGYDAFVDMLLGGVGGLIMGYDAFIDTLVGGSVVSANFIVG